MSVNVLEKWKHSPEGEVIVGPITGWQIARTPLIGIMRLEYAYNEKEKNEGGRFAQLSITAVQARELARAFMDLANKLEQQDSDISTRQ